MLIKRNRQMNVVGHRQSAAAMAESGVRSHSSRSAPRTTSVIPCSPSSTAEAGGRRTPIGAVQDEISDFPRQVEVLRPKKAIVEVDTHTLDTHAQRACGTAWRQSVTAGARIDRTFDAGDRRVRDLFARAGAGIDRT
jgi:hypothetical protein